MKNMGLNISNEQKEMIKKTPDEGMESNLPMPSDGDHEFEIVGVKPLHDDYGDFLSLAVKCKSVTEPNTRPMYINFDKSERGIIDLGHFYARHVLGKKYDGELIEEADLMNVHIMSKVYKTQGKGDKAGVVYTNISKYSWIPLKSTTAKTDLRPPVRPARIDDDYDNDDINRMVNE